MSARHEGKRDGTVLQEVKPMRTTRNHFQGKMRSRAPSKSCLIATFLLRFLFREYASIRDGLIRPETVIDALQQHTQAASIIVADPGTPCPYFSGYYEHRQAGRYFVTNRAHGAL